MKFVFIFFLTVYVVYLTVGQSEDVDDIKADNIQVKRTDEKDGVFSSEDAAKDFLKDKREPGRGKYYKYGSRLLHMAGHRRYHYGGHRHRYGHHSGSSSSEEEEGGYYGNRYGGGYYGNRYVGGRYGGGGYDWDD